MNAIFGIWCAIVGGFWLASLIRVLRQPAEAFQSPLRFVGRPIEVTRSQYIVVACVGVGSAAVLALLGLLSIR